MHAMEEFGRDCCIRGYHVYKETWPAAIAYAPITFATSLFAAAIAREDRLWERGPFGSGRPSLGLK